MSGNLPPRFHHFGFVVSNLERRHAGILRRTLG